MARSSVRRAGSHGVRALAGGAAVLALCVVARNASAQATDCQVRGAGVVRLVEDPSVGPGAEAGRASDGAPVIRHDPAWWAGASRVLRRFAVLHACAHLELHHGAVPTPAEESLADCHALAMLRNDGVSVSEEAALRDEMTRSLGSPHGASPSGAQRASALTTQCGAPVTAAAEEPTPGTPPTPSEIYRNPNPGQRVPSRDAAPVFRYGGPTGYPMTTMPPPQPINRYSPMVFIPTGRGFLIRPQTPR